MLCSMTTPSCDMSLEVSLVKGLVKNSFSSLAIPPTSVTSDPAEDLPVTFFIFDYIYLVNLLPFLSFLFAILFSVLLTVFLIAFASCFSSAPFTFFNFHLLLASHRFSKVFSSSVFASLSLVLFVPVFFAPFRQTSGLVFPQSQLYIYVFMLHPLLLLNLSSHFIHSSLLLGQTSLHRWALSLISVISDIGLSLISELPISD